MVKNTHQNIKAYIDLKSGGTTKQSDVVNPEIGEVQSAPKPFTIIPSETQEEKKESVLISPERYINELMKRLKADVEPMPTLESLGATEDRF